MAGNKQWIYARKPVAEVGPDNFDLRETEMPEPKAGEVLVRSMLLSLDPASRAWMQGTTYRSQLNPGDVMAGWGLGEVVSSATKGFDPGDMVSGELGWQQYAAISAHALTKHDRKHKPEHIRTRHHRTHRLFRHARCGTAAPGRDRPRLGCRRCGRLHRRPDREDQRLPGRRHHARSRQVQMDRR
jgi:N-terminal domain of oxidoreductase